MKHDGKYYIFRLDKEWKCKYKNREQKFVTSIEKLLNLFLVEIWCNKFYISFTRLMWDISKVYKYLVLSVSTIVRFVFVCCRIGSQLPCVFYSLVCFMCLIQKLHSLHHYQCLATAWYLYLICISWCHHICRLALLCRYNVLVLVSVNFKKRILLKFCYRSS